MDTKKKGLSRFVGVMLFVALAIAVLPPEGGAATGDNTFTFSNSGIAVSGSGTGYEISGTDLKITAAGTYTISGTCADGSVTVKKEITGVTLVLDNLTLSSTSTAPITCNKSSEVTIEATGTSILTDNETATTEASGANFEGAGIKVKSGASLKLTGAGTLTVNGSYKNGIKGAESASITVSNLTLHVTAKNNALASDGSVDIQSGTLTLTAENDAIKAEPDETDTTSKGTVTIAGGTFKITSAGDAIQATGAVTITDGSFDITTGSGYTATLAEDASAKGVKSSTSVLISGGTFTMNCADDAIHSNDAVTVTGGTFKIQTGDDALHADDTLNIGAKDSTTGPDITVSACYEGFEGAVINLYSGSGSIVASDDGINAASSDLGNNYAFALNVYGGKWIVDAGGDGIDSNRDVNLYGGTVEVFGAASGADAALDFDGACNYEGGTLIAIGMSSMAQAPTSGNYVAFGSLGMMGGGGGFGGTGERPEGAADGTMGTPPDGMTGDGGFTRDENATGERPARGERPEGMERPEGVDGTQGGRGNMGGMEDTTNATFTISSGSAITVQDAAGSTLYTTTGRKTATSVVFVSDAVTSGTEYKLLIDGTLADTATATQGTGSAGVQGGARPDGVGNTEGLFSDVRTSDWYYEAVKYVYDKGIMTGTSSTVFAPDSTMTRATLAQTLYRLAGSPAGATGTTFTDVRSGDWYADAVAWASAQGIVTGYTDGSFQPNALITREQLATMLYRYAESKGYDVSARASLGTYSDSAGVSAYASDAMQWAVGASLVSGTDATTLSPQGSATRAQGATILMRLMQNTQTTTA